MENNKKCPYCGSENTRYLVSRGEDLPAFRMCLDCAAVYLPEMENKEKYAWDALIKRLAKTVINTKHISAEPVIYARKDPEPIIIVRGGLTCEDCALSAADSNGLYCNEWKGYTIPAGFCHKRKKGS